MIRVVLARLIHYKSFYKFLALHAGAVFLLVYVASSFTMEAQGQQVPLGQWFSLPDAWQTVAALTRWVYYVLAFFSVQIVCAELEQRLVRAQVIAGMERRDVVLGWLVQSAVITAVAVAVTTLAVLARAKVDAGGSWAFADGARVQLGFALYGLVFLSCAVLAATLMRKPVPAISVLCLWPVALEPSLGYALGKQGLEKWRDYMPFTTLGTLVPWPGSAPFDPAAPTTFVAAGYGVAALALTWLILSRRDL